jgi:hypothetical protein
MERRETVSFRMEERKMECPPAVETVDFVEGANVDVEARLPQSRSVR